MATRSKSVNKGNDSSQQEYGYEPLEVLGDTGLKRMSGIISEEFLSDLTGMKAVRLYTEMADNHPVIGGVLFAITTLIKGVKWRIDAASQTPDDIAAADFVSSCLDDMSATWQDTVSEFLSFLTYGWSYHEICYKIRGGRDNENPLARSRYDDYRVGWDGFPIRSQDSLHSWMFDADSRVVGMVQELFYVLDRNSKKKGRQVTIPASKALHFRTRSHKNNPEGRSILRSAVVPYIRQKKIEDIEAIGMERDLAGYPVAYAPEKYFYKDATPQEKAFLSRLRESIANIRRDKSEGLVLPSDSHPDGGGQKVRIELMSSSGTRQFDTTKVLDRQDKRIAMSLLADFLMLGHEGVGSFALSENKTDLFAVAIGSYLDIITETFNRDAIPKLLELNGMSTETTPKLAHDDLDQRDLTVLANYVTSLAAAGMPMFPDPALEGFLREQAGIPEPMTDTPNRVGTGGGTEEGGGDDPLLP